MNENYPIASGATEDARARLRLSAPAQGARSHVNCPATGSLALEFDPSQATAERQDNDLVFTFDDGATLVVNGYFSTGDTLSPFELPDGSTAPAAEVLFEIADLSTASGPGDPNGSGAGEYADNAGDLIAGVDRLGSLGTDHWNGGMPVREEPFRASPPEAAPRQEEAQPPVPQPPAVEPDYNARAVIYVNDPGKQNRVTTRYLDGKGNPVQGDPDLAFVDGDGADFVAWHYNAEGNLVFTLTDAGKDFLAGPEAPDYVEVLFRVTDRQSGESYTIQVVAPKDGYFSAEDFALNGSRHAGPVGDADLIHGEWHEGDSDSYRDYHSTSSNLDDSYVLNGLYEGTDIRTGYGPGSWGNDRVEIRGDVDNIDGEISLVTGTGQDTVSLYGMYAREGGISLIDTGGDSGDTVNMIWKMQAEGTYNAANAVSRNTIITGDLNLASGTTYGMTAFNTNVGLNRGNNSAENIVDASGSVTISAMQVKGWDAAAMHADNQSLNSGHVANAVRADGDVTLLAVAPENGATQVAGMAANTWYATDHGTAANSIEAGGTVRMEIQGGQGADAYGMLASNNASNSVLADAVDIDVSGSGYTAGVQSSVKDAWGNNWYTVGGKNSLEANDIRIVAQSSGDEAYAVVTGKYGETEIQGLGRENGQGSTLHFEAKGVSAYGVVTTDCGGLPFSPHTTRITGSGGGDSLSIRAEAGQGDAASGGYALGLYSGSTGHNRIDTGEGVDTVSIQALGSNNAMGMSAGSNLQGGKGWGGTDASNAVINAEKVSVLGQSTGGNAYGMFANAGSLPMEYRDQLPPDYETGFNSIVLGNDGDGDRELSVTARALGTGAEAGNAFGMYACNQQAHSNWGYNLVQGDTEHGNTITVTAESRGGQAWGMMSEGPSSRTTTGASNIIRGGDGSDTVTVSATGATLAIGMQAARSAGSITNPALNEINSGTGADSIRVSASATGPGGEAIGLLAYTEGRNALTAQEGTATIDASAANGDASAMFAMGNNAINAVSAATLRITADACGNGDAYGLRTDHLDRYSSAGYNTLVGSEVEIAVTAQGGGSAYGMMANLAANGSAFATGGLNTISAAGGGALTLIIKVAAGTADKAYAMYASGKGQNKILGGEENDLVDLTGRIEGDNLIDTGAGDDTISLNGKVDANLVLKAGDGHDLLILKAAGAGEFTDNYRTWLDSLTDSQLKEMEIEEIWINESQGADWMHDPAMAWFWNFVDRYNDLTDNTVFPDYASHSLDAEIASLAGVFGMEHEPDGGAQPYGGYGADIENGVQSTSFPSHLPLTDILDDEGALSIDDLLSGLGTDSLPGESPSEHTDQADLLSLAQDTPLCQVQNADDESKLLILKVQADIL